MTPRRESGGRPPHGRSGSTNVHGWTVPEENSLREPAHVVDAERLRQLLQRASDDVAMLRVYASELERVRSEPARLGHVKYLFVTVIEGCIDAGQHICSSEGWGPPETNADVFRVLFGHRVLDEQIAVAMARAAGFRNLLVHGYARVEDERVIETLGRLSDLEHFIAAAATMID